MNNGRYLKRRHVVLTILIILPLLAVFSGAAGQSVGDSKGKDAFLADRHKSLGIDCSGCHQESPPKQKPKSSLCMGCHGDYSKVAEKTSKLNINPHDTHMGELDCQQCHKGHQKPVNICNQCHTFTMKIP